MPTIESIKETFIPPLVATVIAILLVTGLQPSSAVDATPTPDEAPVTVLRDRQTDDYLKKMCMPAREPAMPGLMLAVYRIPVNGKRFGDYVEAGMWRRESFSSNS